MSSPARYTRSFTGSACFLSLLKFYFRWDMSFERSSILSGFFTALGRDCVSFWPHFKLSLKSYFYKSTGSPVTQTLAEEGASHSDHRLHDKKIRCPWKTHTHALCMLNCAVQVYMCHHLLTFKPVGLSFFNGTQNKMLRRCSRCLLSSKKRQKVPLYCKNVALKHTYTCYSL